MAALVIALLAACWFPAVAGAEDKVAFTISDSRITESSGLVRDSDRAGYWTVNDSGDGGVVYKLSSSGKVTGSFRYAADPTDVEALARYGNRLYVADIGDNSAKREFVTVYYFTDPPTDGSTVQFRSYDFSYPDGAHDAETLLVDGTGRLYIVTKGKQGAIYAAPGEPSRTALNRLTRIGDAPAWVTDGVFMSDNERIALRTYVSVIVLDANTYAVRGRAAAPAQPQGETVALSLDGRKLMLGSEGNPSKVYEMSVPTDADAKVPTASSTPPGDRSASPSPSGSAGTDTGADSGEDDGSNTVSGRGTLLALGLAALVAVAAGVVVAVVRRP